MVNFDFLSALAPRSVRSRMGASSYDDANFTRMGNPPGSYASESGVGPPVDPQAFSLDNLLLVSDYGPRKSPITGASSYHRGIDLAMPQGTPLAATQGGLASRASDSGCGWNVSIDHGNGWRTTFCHMSRIDIPLGGKQVAKGEVIGLSGGQPGTPGCGTTTGAHLHLMVERKVEDGTWHSVDPVPFVAWKPYELRYRDASVDPRGPYWYSQQFRPAEPGGSRDVPGKSGYVYRQFADGTVQVVKAPGKQVPPSTAYTEGTAAWSAITKEIGPYVPYAEIESEEGELAETPSIPTETPTAAVPGVPVFPSSESAILPTPEEVEESAVGSMAQRPDLLLYLLSRGVRYGTEAVSYEDPSFTKMGQPPGVNASESGVGPPFDKRTVPSDSLLLVSDFGPRIHPTKKVPRFHRGVDLAVPQGTPLAATGNGFASRITDSGCGWGISIDHGNGWRTVFCHMSRYDIPQEGKAVVRGEQVGLSGGAEGTPGCGMSTGAHLHYDLKRKGADGKWHSVDPVPFTNWSPYGMRYRDASVDPRGTYWFSEQFQPKSSGASRDVPGRAGWTYRQFVDGSIQIVGRPDGRPLSPSIYREGDGGWAEITKEIGPYVPYRKPGASPSPAPTATPAVAPAAGPVAAPATPSTAAPARVLPSTPAPEPTSLLTSFMRKVVPEKPPEPSVPGVPVAFPSESSVLPRSVIPSFVLPPVSAVAPVAVVAAEGAGTVFLLGAAAAAALAATAWRRASR